MPMLHRDTAVQTTPMGLTLIIDDDTTENKGKGAVRRHLAQYGDQVSDDLALGWDCGICFETAEEPCVTRCGHLYCQAHLHHWLATHPSCPVCKTACTPTEDVVPIFSRGRASPPPSLDTPSPETAVSSSAPPQRYFTTPSPSPTPPLPEAFPLASSRPSASFSGDFDLNAFPLSPPRCTPSPPSVPASPAPSPSPTPTPPSPSLSPLSPLHSPRPHPLLTAHSLAHRAGLALRVLALAILLGVLLR